MAQTNAERLTKAIGLLAEGLKPYCEATWKGFYGDDWLNTVNNKLRTPDRTPKTTDLAFLFKGLLSTWREIFEQAHPKQVHSLIFELRDVRNAHAHNEQFTTDDTLRALDSMERLVEAFGQKNQQKAIKDIRRELQRIQLEEESRNQRRKTAAQATQNQATAGLTPWRDIITPHADVAAGEFEQAEFAADLIEVHNGDADSEYQDPTAFFARTYLTQGLKELLTGAADRLSGKGGDPVIELQTNFGGGKTHSMIALHHLASGVPVQNLPGVAELFAEQETTIPDEINRAVFVGQAVSPAAPKEVEKGVIISTMWGHIAYQLGGKEAYELVRIADETGTNPGEGFKKVLQQNGPAIILIDEWVAYARQLNDAGQGARLAGGDFDTQFTFAQWLTESAKSVDNVVVLISIPSSDLEVGGKKGKDALERLKNVVTRVASQWKPASPDESFEIVRRRLFDPLTSDQIKIRDGVIGAFHEMYRTSPADFPSKTSDIEYRRRMEICYPIHPELFDRLFEEWAALDKFQRTRGVLRLMATVISELWNRGDQSLMIMPGNLPLDAASTVSELTRYLEEGWDTVIKSDVDGENALPLRIDKEHTHLGKLSATRRASRSVYMGSAPKEEGKRGVDIKSIVLACTQPGEPPKQFEDALRRLSGLATHLYVDGSQYWYQLQQNVTRLAADRAASNYTDNDADDEIKKRLIGTSYRPSFSAMQIFPDGPGDVPDDDDGVRLVVLQTSSPHVRNSDESDAIKKAEEILQQRSAGPRINKNLLIFCAADSTILKDLRETARTYLAWESIVNDSEDLDLRPNQLRQAQSKLDESESTVSAQIIETYRHILTPKQKPSEPEIKWIVSKPTGDGHLIERIANKLNSDEGLIKEYAGVRIKMDIDRYQLWSDSKDLTVKELWEAYCRYPYMTRLNNFDTLANSISNGIANIAWKDETFGYAEAFDEEKHVGIHVGEHANILRSGIILHPEIVPSEENPILCDKCGNDPCECGHCDECGESPCGCGSIDTKSDTKFYARFELNHGSALRELQKIVDEVASHLGDDVTYELEIHADNTDGYSETVKRTVGENANNLGAIANEFEE